ncbi:hypothetical protein BC831DRAFT_481694 [Entophlyctis helioformis]|nr:hypothetical protein BC831DRAFT_481694 [Entophlyctis helioformis]
MLPNRKSRGTSADRNYKATLLLTIPALLSIPTSAAHSQDPSSPPSPLLPQPADTSQCLQSPSHKSHLQVCKFTSQSKSTLCLFNQPTSLQFRSH